jgi:hypothetical protein
MAERANRERAEAEKRRMVAAGLGDLIAVEEEEKRAEDALDPIEEDAPVVPPPTSKPTIVSLKRGSDVLTAAAPAVSPPKPKPAAASGMALLAKFRLKGKAAQSTPQTAPVAEEQYAAATEETVEPQQQEEAAVAEEDDYPPVAIVKKRPKFIAEDDD